MSTTPPPFILSPQDAAWGRWVNDRIATLERQGEQRDTEITATSKGMQASLGGMQETILSAGLTMASATTVSPTSANSASWVTKATTMLTVPSGRSRAIASLSGAVALLDTASAGGVAAPPSARFVIAGLYAPLIDGRGVPATKDSGASAVNNVITLSAALEIGNLTPGTKIVADLQVYTAHATAYATASPSNFATIALQATFLS